MNNGQTSLLTNHYFGWSNSHKPWSTIHKGGGAFLVQQDRGYMIAKD